MCAYHAVSEKEAEMNDVYLVFTNLWTNPDSFGQLKKNVLASEIEAVISLWP